MWERQNFFQILFLLLIKVSIIQSDCDWDSKSVENCSLKCKSNNWPWSLTSISKTLSYLNTKWAERGACHGNGLDLTLENIAYDGNVVAANFFTADVNVKVNKLTLSLNPLKSEAIAVGAFNQNGLKFMKELVISNAVYTPIKSGTFNGLVNLEVLQINGKGLEVIEPGVLDALNGTLTEFSLKESSIITLKESREIFVDGLTGAGALDKLETVTFNYNLKTTITRGSFTGLTNVKTLDLSNCQIEEIGWGSFDALHFLELLKLKDNRIATISDGFFNNILIRNRTQIFLEGNRFLCDCALMPFKLSLIEHSNFVGHLTCYEPDKFKGWGIVEKTFVDETCVVPTTTTMTTVTTYPSLPTSTTSSPARQCQSSEKSETISIAPPAHTMEVHQTEGDEVLVRVDNWLENSILIWYSAFVDPIDFNATANTNCLITSEPTVHINNLQTNLAYTLCLMSRTEVTISPLDCVSFVKRSVTTMKPWIYQNVRNRFIGVTFVTYSVTILLGLAIGGLTHRMRTMKREQPFIRRYQSSRCSSMSRRTTNTTVQYFTNGNYDTAPPLPARPASMYLMDEPVYATIRDIRSILASSSQETENDRASNEVELRTTDNFRASNEVELRTI